MMAIYFKYSFFRLKFFFLKKVVKKCHAIGLIIVEMHLFPCIFKHLNAFSVQQHKQPLKSVEQHGIFVCTVLFYHREGITWSLHQMVTQNMLCTYKGKNIRFMFALYLIKCLKQIKMTGLLLTCATISEYHIIYVPWVIQGLRSRRKIV